MEIQINESVMSGWTSEVREGVREAVDSKAVAGTAVINVDVERSFRSTGALIYLVSRIPLGFSHAITPGSEQLTKSTIDPSRYNGLDKACCIPLS